MQYLRTHTFSSFCCCCANGMSSEYVCVCVWWACASFRAAFNAVYCCNVITYTFYHIMMRPWLMACHSSMMARPFSGRHHFRTIISLPHPSIVVLLNLALFICFFNSAFFRFYSSESHENWRFDSVCVDFRAPLSTHTSEHIFFW